MQKKKRKKKIKKKVQETDCERVMYCSPHKHHTCYILLVPTAHAPTQNCINMTTNEKDAEKGLRNNDSFLIY
jgi:hypothetical protein